MSYADKISKRTFPTRDVVLCLDAALSAERDAAIAEVTRLSQVQEKAREAGSSRMRNPELAAAQKKVAELEERMRDSLVTIRVTGVKYAEYNSIQFAHKPRKGHNEAYNPISFFPDLVYKSSYEIDGETVTKLTDTPRSAWDALVEELTDAEFTELANAVIAVNGIKAGTGFLDRTA
jgi:hypothetical protein